MYNLVSDFLWVMEIDPKLRKLCRDSAFSFLTRKKWAAEFKRVPNSSGGYLREGKSKI